MNYKMKATKEEWELIGTIGVDAGIVQICDPCYTQDPKVADYWKRPGVDYNANATEERGVMTIPFGVGATWANENNVSAGVIVNSGLGDGCYEVYAKFIETFAGKRIAAVLVEFIDTDEDDEGG